MLEVKVVIEAPQLCETLVALFGRTQVSAPAPVEEAPAEEAPKEDKPRKASGGSRKASKTAKAAVATDDVKVPLATPADAQEAIPEKTYTLEEIGRIGALVVDKVGVQPVMDLIREKYGVLSIQELPQARYAEFVEDLNDLNVLGGA